MTRYEKAMLKLKMVELTQNQTLISFASHDYSNKEKVHVSNIAKETLEIAITETVELIG